MKGRVCKMLHNLLIFVIIVVFGGMLFCQIYQFLCGIIELVKVLAEKSNLEDEIDWQNKEIYRPQKKKG